MADFTLVSPLTMLIDGANVAGHTGINVINPATGRAFAYLPGADALQLQQAFAAADRAFAAWSADQEHRRKVLAQMAEAIEARVDEVAPILTAEQGKPLRQSHRELTGVVSRLRYLAGLDLEPLVLRDDDVARVEAIHRPLGVTAAIAPFNFPLIIGMAKVAAALRAGNTVVLKPSPYTPLSTLKLGEILTDVVPAGVVNVISGGNELGPMMTTNPLTRVIDFTGSTGTGRRIAEAAAPYFKRIMLEMGGNDPAIILDDVDVEQVAKEIFARAFNNSGQACVAVKRVYAPRSLRPALVEALAECANAATVGDGFDPNTEYGPLNNAAQFQRVVSLVDDAVASGARIVTGGKPIEGPGYFHELTIVDTISDGVPLVDEEQFGPVLPVVEYEDVDDAVRRANLGEYGLGASAWSADPDRAESVARRLQAGMVWANTHTVSDPGYPFPGTKASGVGVIGGRWAVEGGTDLQVVYTAKQH